MSQQPFTPANPLEESLQRAAADPGARPAFYRMLLENDVYLLTPNAPEESGKMVLEQDTQVTFVHWDGPRGHYIPMFTSLERLREAVNQRGATYGYLAINARTIFDILIQNTLPACLNPGSPCGKEFLTHEMKSLADGSFFQANQTKVKQNTPILMGQPKVYPTQLVEALKTLFGRHSSVVAAYLAQVHFQGGSDPPHIMIGIECPGAMPVVAPEAVVVAEEVVRDGTIVDFIEVGSGKSSLEAYFKQQTQPFYTRAAAKPRWKFW